MIRRPILAILTVAYLASRGEASQMFVAETATVSGSIFGFSFTNRTMLLQETYDWTLVTTGNDGARRSANGLLSIHISGYATVYTTASVFVSPTSTGSALGFTRSENSTGSPADLLDTLVTPATS